METDNLDKQSTKRARFGKRLIKTRSKYFQLTHSFIKKFAYPVLTACKNPIGETTNQWRMRKTPTD